MAEAQIIHWLALDMYTEAANSQAWQTVLILKGWVSKLHLQITKSAVELLPESFLKVSQETVGLDSLEVEASSLAMTPSRFGSTWCPP